jgi:hypothetical protein
MARASITAPIDPSYERAARSRELAARGAQRTPAQNAELLDLAIARIDDLEARLNQVTSAG